MNPPGSAQPPQNMTAQSNIQSPIESHQNNLGSHLEADAKAQAKEMAREMAREIRILKKKLTRSEKTRAEMEGTNARRERMLKEALKKATADREQLAQAKAQLMAFNRELTDRMEVESAALSEATDNLQLAKVQVVKSEKFSSLGELVAGVAHEINNPIGCVTSNLKFVEDYGEQLLEHIELQQTVIEANISNLQAADIEKINDHAQEIELDYIIEDFPKLIEAMVTSGDRITNISQSLRTFARADTTTKQSYDLHKGIDGTLLILRHRLKAVGSQPAITIQKNYGEISPIQCYPGQINQVFMNILANAIDAIAEGEEPDDAPEISVTTAMDAKQVVVTITDNAGGMPESVRSHIFENQFTTKTAGKGTGLGLSIAHQIVVDTHQGHIDCNSVLGSGTTFRIALPID